jgi:hypothetical protein
MKRISLRFKYSRILCTTIKVLRYDSSFIKMTEKYFCVIRDDSKTGGYINLYSTILAKYTTCTSSTNTHKSKHLVSDTCTQRIQVFRFYSNFFFKPKNQIDFRNKIGFPPRREQQATARANSKQSTTIYQLKYNNT